MKKVALTELDPRLQKQITAADQQLKANPQYAVEVLTGILVRNPGCIEVRRTLRKAQKALHGTKKGLFDGITGALTSGKIAKSVESDPLAAIAAAEEDERKKSRLKQVEEEERARVRAKIEEEERAKRAAEGKQN